MAFLLIDEVRGLHEVAFELFEKHERRLSDVQFIALLLLLVPIIRRNRFEDATT